MTLNYGSNNRNMNKVCSVYILTTSFIMKINAKSGTYLTEVENHRVNGKGKQRFIRYIDKDINAVPVRGISSKELQIVAM